MWTVVIVALALVVIIGWMAVRAKRKAIRSAYVNAEEQLKSLEERDAALFAQGKSFDEIISQYKHPDRRG